MFVRFIACLFGAVLAAGLAVPSGAVAQPQPSAAAVALATQILELKGGIGAFDPALEGVIVHHKNTFLQINPNVATVLANMEPKLLAEAAAKRKELHVEVARAYAAQFTEKELKDLLAFYNTPLGKKVIEGEPKAGIEAAKRAQVWIDKYATEMSTKMRADLKSKGFSEF
jgi:hypothetical protein